MNTPLAGITVLGLRELMSAHQISKRSLIGLNAANFFQAEMVGGVLPALNIFLRKAHWRYEEIGTTFVAFAGLAALGAIIFTTFVPETRTEPAVMQESAA